jgi:hypothetical protein
MRREQTEQLGGRTMDVAKKRGENKGSKNSDKKIVVVKIAIQNKKQLL